MHALHCVFWIALLAACAAQPVRAAADEADLEVVNRIKQEAFQRSRVMDYVHLLADENGARMTGSPGYRRAADHAIAALKAAGIGYAQLEPWGQFGRGWDWSRVGVHMLEPSRTTLIAYPADFSPATGGAVTGEVTFAPLWDQDGDAPRNGDLEQVASRIEVWKRKYEGTLAGRIVMLDHPRRFTLEDEPPARRFSAEDLGRLGERWYNGPVDPGPVPELEWPIVRLPADPEERARMWEVMPLEYAADRWQLERRLSDRIAAFLAGEGVVAVLVGSWASGAGIVQHSDYGSHLEDSPVPPPTVVLAPEHYQRIHRLIEREVPVRLEVEVDASFYPGAEGTNVIAELAGASRSGELVMIGAHLDSWHGATGATDNAAGCAVVMEAMRILAALDRPLKRTVRAALWDGEEQGLIGSRAYVARHFADPVTMALERDHARLSAYFNFDSGGGRVRGVYLQQNDMARPIVDAWLAPFAEQGVAGATIINSFGSDHLAFNAVGLPGFTFVQDPLDYEDVTHHSNADDASHLVAGDLMQAAAVVATVAYHAAMRDERMPRVALPAALPARGELPESLR
jgi:hypothetical protein